MTDNENKIWADFYHIYAKYRDMVIRDDQTWADFAAELGACAVVNDYEHNPLTFRLFDAVHMAISDLYKGGAEPVQVSFLGRADL